jgi:hypothetical protein
MSLLDAHDGCPGQWRCVMENALRRPWVARGLNNPALVAPSARRVQSAELQQVEFTNQSYRGLEREADATHQNSQVGCQVSRAFSGRRGHCR